MSPETVERLSKELQDPEGFSSYKEVHQWLQAAVRLKWHIGQYINGQDIGSKEN
jgi:hypothetical protein